MPPKDFQKCLRRIVCPKVHGHANHCLDGFGLKGTGINPSAKPKTPLGWEFVVLERDLAAERKAFPGWKPADSKKWDKEYKENLLTPRALASRLNMVKGHDGKWKRKEVPPTVVPPPDKVSKTPPEPVKDVRTAADALVAQHQTLVKEHQ